ncbi:hypothetical protein [Pseudonocardia nigra]|uniref:hypothetical protein n=1 Tax=Pseudonocardia nigra TaxID=1921578 RepID=UPI001C6043FD|nr:hypothetical protein [Pseudonocardia nigra]
MPEILFALTIGAILVLIGRTVHAPRVAAAAELDPGLLRDFVLGCAVVVRVGRAHAATLERFIGEMRAH